MANLSVYILHSFVIFILLLNETYTSYALSEYILAPGGNCDSTIVSKESVLVKSHTGASMYGGLTSYEANTDCEVTFVVESGKNVLVLFPFFDLQAPSGDTCVDRLQLYDVTDGLTTPTYTTGPTTEMDNTTGVTTENTTTGNLTTEEPTTVTTDATTTDATTTDISTTDTPNVTSSDNVTSSPNVTSSSNVTSSDNTTVITSTPEPGDYQVICVNPTSYVSTTNQSRIRFITDGTTQKKGFNLVVTSFHNGTCEDDEFQCDTTRCISSSLKCDGTVHCVDGADESATEALCTTDSDATNDSSGLGSLAVLAICIVGGIIFFAIISVVIFWKYIKGEATCGGSEIEPEEPEVVVNKEVTMHKPMKKKSVTVGGVTKGDKPSEPELSGPKKPIVKTRKVKQNPDDVDW